MSGSNITGSFDVVLKCIMPYNLHKIRKGMTPFKMWRGILKKADGENKVNLIFTLFRSAVWITFPEQLHKHKGKCVFFLLLYFMFCYVFFILFTG